MRVTYSSALIPILLLGMLLCSGPAPAKSSATPASLLRSADNCRKSLYRSAAKKKYRHNWTNCIKRYERIYTRHPKSGEAAWALYHSARLFADLSRYSGRTQDLDAALTRYRRLAGEYQAHRLADDAQYKLGELYYQRKKDPSQAYIEFLKVDIKFPAGDMRPRARKMLDKLAVVLSEKQEEGESPGGETRSGLVTVEGIRHWSTPSYTRVVVDLEGPVQYSHHLLKPDPNLEKPRRLYLDLAGARVSSNFDDSIPIGDGLLQRARAGQYKKDTVRVVLDSGSIGGYKIFHLHDPFRIVVDVKRQNGGAEERKARVAAKPPVRKGTRKAEDSDGKPSLARQLGLNVSRIVIDPGHGGKDPGCITRDGIREKDIVLRMAKVLAERLRSQIGCQVFLTRDRDVFLSLEQRTAIANMKKADLFISLHINAHRNRRIWGLETYFLNIATDERAVMVAARENATSEKNISDLQRILNDLMLNTKINESSRLAGEVQEGVVTSVSNGYKLVKSLGVKQAPFYVLIGAQMPAVLVEAGFLTNSMERKRLVSRGYHKRVAAGITNGVKSYIESIGRVAGIRGR